MELKGSYGVTLNQEIDTSYILMSLKTTIGENPTFKGRLGIKIGSPELHVVVFIVPIFNLNLKTMKYNTPFNAEIRYTPKIEMCNFKFCFGTEIYKDGTYTYLNVLIPFK
ncbi:MAG: hypothetical protein IPK55_10745 [Streptococcus sp.]|nr:hypothetical protein [Streptococcus sp.]